MKIKETPLSLLFSSMKSEFNFVISNSHAIFFLLSHNHTFFCHFWANTIITIPSHFPTHLYFYNLRSQIGTSGYYIHLSLITILFFFYLIKPSQKRKKIKHFLLLLSIFDSHFDCWVFKFNYPFWFLNFLELTSIFLVEL